MSQLWFTTPMDRFMGNSVGSHEVFSQRVDRSSDAAVNTNPYIHELVALWVIETVHDAWRESHEAWKQEHCK